MIERHASEVEKVLLYVEDARTRAKRAADALEKDGAEQHVVAALRETERQLDDQHTKLAQGTYYAISDATLKLAV
jgi:hypothetical protein